MGREQDALVLDLGDEVGRAVVIEPGTWIVVDRSPILFRRTALTSALPVPTVGGDLDLRGDMLNVSAHDWPLVVGHLVAALVPDIRHPILWAAGAATIGEIGDSPSAFKQDRPVACSVTVRAQGRHRLGSSGFGELGGIDRQHLGDQPVV